MDEFVRACSETWVGWQLADSRQDMYMEFYEEVCRRTAQLVAGWQCVGFCHGASSPVPLSTLLSFAALSNRVVPLRAYKFDPPNNESLDMRSTRWRRIGCAIIWQAG